MARRGERKGAPDVARTAPPIRTDDCAAELRFAVGAAGLVLVGADFSGANVKRRTRYDGAVEGHFGFELVRGALHLSFETRDPGLAAAPYARLTTQRTPRGQARTYRELVLGDDELDRAYALELPHGDASVALVLRARDPLLSLTAYDVAVVVDAGALDVSVRALDGGRVILAEHVGPIVTSLVALWRAWGAPEHIEEQRAPAVAIDRAGPLLAPLRAAVDAAASRYGGRVERVGSTWETRLAIEDGDGGAAFQAALSVAPREEGAVVDVALDASVPPSSPPLQVLKRRTLIGQSGSQIVCHAPAGALVRRDARALDALMREIELTSAPASGQCSARGAVDAGLLERALTALVDLWAALCRRHEPS